MDKTAKNGNDKELILLHHAHIGFSMHHGYDVKEDWITQDEENIEKSLSNLVNKYAIRNKENALKSLDDYANLHRNLVSFIKDNME